MSLKIKQRFPWLITLCTAVILGVCLTYLSAYQNDQNFATFLIWFSSLLAIAVIPCARYQQGRTLLFQARRTMKSQLRKQKKDIANDLKVTLRPRVDSCKTQDEVF